MTLPALMLISIDRLWRGAERLSFLTSHLIRIHDGLMQLAAIDDNNDLILDFTVSKPKPGTAIVQSSPLSDLTPNHDR